MKVVEYEMGGGGGKVEKRKKRLLLVIHHLVVDGVSWRILLEDLERGYEQLKRGEEMELGSKTSSFKQWGERLREYAEQERVKEEVEYWSGEEKKRVKPLARDYEYEEEGKGGGGGKKAGKDLNLVGGQRNVVEELEEEETRALLQAVPEAYNTQINDVLLTALGRSLEEWSGGEGVLVDVEGHGREEIFADVDVSRTVGWFSSTYPILLEGSKRGSWEPGKALSTVKEQLRAVPNRGLGYGLLRYLSKDEETRKRLREMPKAEIVFNYLGQVDQVLRASALLAPAKESSGPPSASQNRRPYVLDVNAVVAQGKLQVNWGYSENLHRRGTIEIIAGKFMECLREVIAHCRREEAGGFTPSDFVGANNMTQKELMQIAAILGK
jgi:non-ribosomal peptide synthase protein (TIGR01720 family)